MRCCKPSNGRYDFGYKRNFAEVFGDDKLLWALPIFTSKGNGFTFQTVDDDDDDETSIELVIHSDEDDDNDNDGDDRNNNSFNRRTTDSTAIIVPH